MFAFALIFSYAWACAQLFAAHRLSTHNKIEDLQHAALMAPWNAEYHYGLGRAFTLAQMDFDKGVAEYKQAIALNPHSARYWLDLAAAYQIMGRAGEQRLALEHATQVEPNTPEVAWEVATFYVVQGDLQRAAPHFRTALSSQPGEITSILSTLWTVSDKDVDLILNRILPPDPELYLKFLQFSIEKKDLQATDKIWQAIVALKKPVDIHASLPYFQYLISAHESEKARAAWQQLPSIDRRLQEYMPTQENLAVNGGFEEDLLGGGLEWIFERHWGVELKADTLEFRSGNHSLSAVFDSSTAPALGVVQYIPVKPGTSYHISGFMKAESLITASGPRIAVSDAYTNQPLFASGDISGTTAWKEFSGNLKTNTDTSLVKLEVVRSPGASFIKGRLYMDDFSLRQN